MPAAIRALRKDPIHVAEGAPARLDTDRVREQIKGAGIHVLLGPFRPEARKGGDFYDQVYAPLSDWVHEGVEDRELILVSGLDVQLISAGTVSPGTMRDARERLERYDVTNAVLFGIRYLQDGVEKDIPWNPATRTPKPAETKALVGHLRRSRAHHAAGAAVRLDDEGWRKIAGHPVRIAVLPPLTLNQPVPNLLPALTRALPGEIVVVVRGRWFEAAGPVDSAMLDTARDYAASLTHVFQLRQQFPMDAVLHAFFQRVQLLRAGEPYQRPMARPARIDVSELVARFAPWTLVLSALVLGLGSIGWWSLRTARERRAEVIAVRIGRAELLAEIAALGADILTLRPTRPHQKRRLAEAAERHATARAVPAHRHPRRGGGRPRGVARRRRVGHGGPRQPRQPR